MSNAKPVYLEYIYNYISIAFFTYKKAIYIFWKDTLDRIFTFDFFLVFSLVVQNKMLKLVFYVYVLASIFAF